MNTRNKARAWLIKLTSLGALVLAGGYAGQVAAVCSITGGISNSSMSVPLVTNLTMSPGDSIPDGTVLYRQTVKFGSVSWVRCDIKKADGVTDAGSEMPYGLKYEITGTPITTSTNLSFPTHNANTTDNKQFSQVYDSGVQGIGVIFWYNTTPIPDVGSTNVTYVRSHEVDSNKGYAEWAPKAGDSAKYTGQVMSIDFSLVKIGNIKPGTVKISNISLSVKPVRFQDNRPKAAAVPGSDALTIVTLKFNPTSGLEIKAPTCDPQLSDTAVPFGDIEADSIKKYTSTDVAGWKDVTIKLNCSNLYGYDKQDGNIDFENRYVINSNDAYYQYNDQYGNLGTLSNRKNSNENLIAYELMRESDHEFTTNDDDLKNNGVIKTQIDGLGIQIATVASGINSNDSSSKFDPKYTFQTKNDVWGHSAAKWLPPLGLTTTGATSTNVSIKLKARVVKTDDRGSLNGGSFNVGLKYNIYYK